jgi:phytoene dehydrogenase-like protein
MKKPFSEVIIVGAGLAGLACARRLAAAGIPFLILEADRRIGGRLKTDRIDGFLLDHGFQVLQTAYPEARRCLDYDRLWSTATAPIGTIGDRLRMIKLALTLNRANVSALFERPDTLTPDFLRAEGFSEKIIEKFFIPFFSGISLDPEIEVSSRVFQYIFRIFAAGDVALPAAGMGAIPRRQGRVHPS